MKNITGKIESSIRREASYLDIKKVFIALSGGADSIAVAYALRQSGIKITALHCNFHLRGDESNRDMDFVKKFCESIGIPLKIKDFNVKQFQNYNKGFSIEMACRDLRYNWFRDQLKLSDFDRIVTGHNADDNIETFFLNILRGSGTRGLKGMDSDNGIIWRPLIQFHRSEILNYLEEYNLEFVVDSTNLTTDYRRNYLRHNVIPILQKEWKGFNSALDKTISNLSGENKIVEKSIYDSLPPTGKPLLSKVILSFPAPLLLIKRYIDPLEPFATTPLEVLKAIKANKPHIRRWNLKKGKLLLKNGRLFIEISHSESCS